ncbi:MAG: hypothetical protein ABGW77_00495 [Campylobacterales bacterium]
MSQRWPVGLEKGGPGSYIIGLSQIEIPVGGNAITGATILNGISIELIRGLLGKSI